jgi:DNA-binding response OmpR family regulator
LAASSFGATPVAEHITPSTRRILVIDDDETLASLLHEVLADQHYQVETCTDGESAYRHAVICQPDLIVLDLLLGGIHGLTILSQLKQDPRTQSIPILVSSAASDQLNRVHRLLQTLGCQTLAKPFDLDELVDRIQHLARTAVHPSRMP